METHTQGAAKKGAWYLQHVQQPGKGTKLYSRIGREMYPLASEKVHKIMHNRILLVIRV